MVMAISRVFGFIFVLIQYIFAIPYVCVLHLVRALRIIVRNFTYSMEIVFDENVEFTDIIQSTQPFILIE